MYNACHVDWLIEGRESWNSRRTNSPEFTPHLAGIDIAEKLRNAGKTIGNYVADLRGYNLVKADLRGAKLIHTDLSSSNLTLAKLGKTEFWCSDLTNVNISKSSPWKAHLFGPPDDGTIQGDEDYQNVLADDEITITTSSRLLDSVSKLQKQYPPDNDVSWYFRGEACDSWHRIPSVMRTLGHREAEKDMLTDMMTRQPNGFDAEDSFFGKLVIAQHFKLPTRLLDITRNPLVALYNASEKHDHQGIECESDGRLHVFAVPRNLIKPFNSDVISVVANFARLARKEQEALLGFNSTIHSSLYEQTLRRLIHFISQEKSYFQQRINPLDLFRVFVVEPQQSFHRIRAQSGAFLISAYHDNFDRNKVRRVKNAQVYDQFELTIPYGRKNDLLGELSQLAIARDQLFPSLDETAAAIKQKYATDDEH
ncbi:MAG: FRG domain-containing protein [Chloroflexi bacterium]|nr:FRG domain-containing protein [Chloroflexota bacterium]